MTPSHVTRFQAATVSCDSYIMMCLDPTFSRGTSKYSWSQHLLDSSCEGTRSKGSIIVMLRLAAQQLYMLSLSSGQVLITHPIWSSHAQLISKAHKC